MNSEEFLSKILAMPDQSARRLDAIFNDVEDAILAKDFAFPEAVMSKCDVDVHPITDLLALLTLTNIWRDYLPGRPAFYARVVERVTRTDPDRAVKLLKGLK